MTTRLALLVAALALSGCTAWSRPQPPSRALLDANPSRVRLELADGRRLLVERPRAQGDTLVGDTLSLRNMERLVRHPFAVPLGRVRSVSTHGVSAGRTLLFVLALPAGALAVCAMAPGCLNVNSWP